MFKTGCFIGDIKLPSLKLIRSLMTPEKLVVERRSSALWDGLVSGSYVSFRECSGLLIINNPSISAT